jgi:hypothetical protein
MSVIIPIKVKKVNSALILGYNDFPELYANIFLCARKNSGKTNVINTILQNCADKNTIVYIFSSTHEKDAN